MELTLPYFSSCGDCMRVNTSTPTQPTVALERQVDNPYPRPASCAGSDGNMSFVAQSGNLVRNTAGLPVLSKSTPCGNPEPVSVTTYTTQGMPASSNVRGNMTHARTAFHSLPGSGIQNVSSLAAQPQYENPSPTWNFDMFRDTVKAAAESAARAAVEVTSTRSHSPSTDRVKMPPLKLPTFSGDVLDWPEFWALFSNLVHDRSDLELVAKFGYLKAQLKGSAAKSIAGISITPSNYSIAVNTLKRKFGSPDIVIAHLHVKLRNLPISSAKFSDVKHTVETLESYLNQLDTLGQDTDSQQSLVHLILSKFPIEITVWLTERRDTSPWNMKTLREALHRYVDIHEHAHHMASVSTSHSNGTSASAIERAATYQCTNDTNLSHTSAIVASTPGAKPLKCSFCADPHFNADCTKYNTPESRKKRLGELGCCYICLRAGHLAKKCPKGRRQCTSCGKTSHHRLLCQVNPSSKSTPNKKEQNTVAKEAPTSTVVTASSAAMKSTEIVLQTALVQFDGDEPICARILFDTGSHRSYISSPLVERLKLPTARSETLSVSTFATTSAYRMTCAVVQFDLPLSSGKLCMEAFVVPHITNPVERFPLQAADSEHLAKYVDIRLADPPPLIEPISQRIDILIGLDYYWEIIESFYDTLPSGLKLLQSRLGVVICGRLHCSLPVSQLSPKCTTLLVSTIVDQTLNTDTFQTVDDFHTHCPNVSDLWNLETIGICDPIKETPLPDTTQEFSDSSVRQIDGRYQVRWPWKTSNGLRTNYGLALGRLKSLAKRFEIDRSLFERYGKILQDQLSKGVIERVAADVMSCVGTIKHYLPHHPVQTPSKTTTKLRIVYDASARVNKHDPSLNECLHRGPISLPSLCGILLRFRLDPIAMCSDVEKAFLQLSIHPEDRDATRFLWFRDSSIPDTSHNNIETYRFCRVPFGLICSPFLLEATVWHHLCKYNSPTAALILDNVYVDNVMLGAHTIDKAIHIFHESVSMFKDASMNLREWTSNSVEFMSLIPSSSASGNKFPKVLGLSWDTEKDEIRIPGVAFSLESELTKRKAVQQLCRLYDPLGFLNPVIVHAKLFLQQLWSLKSWDSPIPDAMLSKYSEVVRWLNDISSVSIPRFLGIPDCTASLELHVFCDSSVNCYATAVYLRSVLLDHIQSHLVYSKLRLTPTKLKSQNSAISIPRLELLAVLIGVRAMQFVRSQLKRPINSVTIWTDSLCVLQWISTTKRLSVFVGNRIKEIRSHVDVTYRHVPSSHNPADIPTRGYTTDQLRHSDLWWSGPGWLTSCTDTWPNEHPVVTYEIIKALNSEECLSQTISSSGEGSKTEVLHCMLVGGNELPINALLSSKSSLYKLLRTIVVCLKFLKSILWLRITDNTRDLFMKKHTLMSHVFSKLTVSATSCTADLSLAVLVSVGFTQRQYFQDVIEACRRSGKNHSFTKSLSVVVDEFGLLRCSGRYGNAKLSFDAKFPLLLPRFSKLTSLIILDTHERLLHSGVSHTLAIVRTQFWIPQGRAAVRHVISRCVLCKKLEGHPYRLPPMAPWPMERLSPSRPFQHSGVDYIGPFKVKDLSERPVKLWICLFTCFATRGIHLEYCMSISTEDFIRCLRRFVSRRGLPATLYSDNAPQFKVASEFINFEHNHVALSTDLVDKCTKLGVTWKFTTEYSPWEGGLYERLVGLTKRTLRKVIGRTFLTIENFRTLLVEVEAVNNSRPLTYVDADGGHSITPAHFMNTAQITFPYVSSGDEFDPVQTTATTLKRKLKKLESLITQYWNVWRKEYLLSLRERGLFHRNKKSSTSIPVPGELVLIEDMEQHVPRAHWKLGRIVNVNTGADGLVRSVNVKMPNQKVLKRSLSHVYPMEVRQETPSAEVASSSADNTRIPMRRSARATANVAKERISKMLHSDSDDDQ